MDKTGRLESLDILCGFDMLICWLFLLFLYRKNVFLRV